MGQKSALSNQEPVIMVRGRYMNLDAIFKGRIVQCNGKTTSVAGFGEKKDDVIRTDLIMFLKKIYLKNNV